MQLAQAYPQFIEADCEIIAVGPTNRTALSASLGKLQLPYPLVADPDHHIAQSYGQPVNWLRLGRLPSQFLIDKRGIVRFAEYGKSMRDATPPDKLLHILKQMF